MKINTTIQEITPISHNLVIEVDGHTYKLNLFGNSKFRVTDENMVKWDSDEIDFRDKLKFSVKIFDRLLCCFAFNIDILKYLIEEQETLEKFINLALADIDMTENTFRVRNIPIARSNIRLRTYIDYDKLNPAACCILLSPEFRSIITKHNMTKKIEYVKMIAKQNKCIPIAERVLRSIGQDFKYPIQPMTPKLVEDFLITYLKR